MTSLNSKVTECPHCRTNLVHSEISAESRHYYLGWGPDNKPLPDDGRFLFYSRVIGQSSYWYDRCLAYTCPDCGVTDVIPGCESMWAKELRRFPVNGREG